MRFLGVLSLPFKEAVSRGVWKRSASWPRFSTFLSCCQDYLRRWYVCSGTLALFVLSSVEDYLLLTHVAQSALLKAYSGDIQGKDRSSHRQSSKHAGLLLPTSRVLRCTTVTVLRITKTSCVVSLTGLGFAGQSFPCGVSFHRVIVRTFMLLGHLDVFY